MFTLLEVAPELHAFEKGEHIPKANWTFTKNESREAGPRRRRWTREN